MERVICVECGSVGYTASPERVNCLECGSDKHRVIRSKYENGKSMKKDRVLSPLGMVKG